MPNNCIKYPGHFSTYHLDKILISSNIKNMSYSQQCKYILSPEAYHLRIKAKSMYVSIVKAYKKY